MDKKLYIELFQKNKLFTECLFFQPYRYSDNYSVIKLSNDIFKQMLNQNPKLKKNASKIKDHLKKVFCNLVVCLYSQKCLIISRDISYYTTQLQSYSVMITILDFLLKHGYINQKLGYIDYQTKKGNKTVIWSLQQLIDLFLKYDVKSSDIKNKKPYTEVVIRDKNKEDLDIEKILSPQQLKFAEQLKLRIGKINIEYAKHSFYMIDDYIYPRIQAIYSRSSLSCGGRLYNNPSKGANYQIVMKNNRKQIKIDGEQTVEVDFSGLHIMMLYAMNGIQYPIDKSPYEFWMKVQKFQDADTLELAKNQAKKAIFTLMNAKNLKDALWSLKEYDYTVNWNNLVDLLLKQHKDIQQYIASDMGIVLQNMDSKMMIQIIENLLNKDIICLGIHDSVIVKKQDKEEAVKVMKKIYEQHLGMMINIK